MCGLVGIAGDTSGVWRDIFTELLVFDSVRGLHSTGAGFVGRYSPLEEAFTLAKEPGHPFNLIHSKEFEDAIASGKSSKVIFGHNRHATFGEKTKENAHPFAFEHVMGMHNGTLDKPSVKLLHNHELYGTDSQAIFATIDKFGIEETMTRLAGAWALIWYDRRNKTLNFLRNDKRPLHYCYSADRCTLIWSSDLDILKCVLERHNKSVDKDMFYVCTKDIHYSWKIPETISKKFDAPEQVEREGKKYIATVYTGPFSPAVIGGKRTNHGGTTITNNHHGSKKSKTAEIPTFVDRLNTRKFRPPYKDQYGRVINKKEFFSMVNEGCAFCNANGQHWSEFIHVMGAYVGYHTPYICEDCYNSDEVYDFAQWAV